MEILLKTDDTEILCTGNDFAVNGGAGSIVVWLTDGTGAVNLNNTTSKIRLGIINSGFSGVYTYSIPGGLGSYTYVVTFREAAQINFGNATLMNS